MPSLLFYSYMDESSLSDVVACRCFVSFLLAFPSKDSFLSSFIIVYVSFYCIFYTNQLFTLQYDEALEQNNQTAPRQNKKKSNHNYLSLLFNCKLSSIAKISAPFAAVAPMWTPQFFACIDYHFFFLCSHVEIRQSIFPIVRRRLQGVHHHVNWWRQAKPHQVRVVLRRCSKDRRELQSLVYG